MVKAGQNNISVCAWFQQEMLMLRSMRTLHVYVPVMGWGKFDIQTSAKSWWVIFSSRHISVNHKKISSKASPPKKICFGGYPPCSTSPLYMAPWTQPHHWVHMLHGHLISMSIGRPLHHRLPEAPNLHSFFSSVLSLLCQRIVMVIKSGKSKR
jgi:hypothetical protein